MFSGRRASAHPQMPTTGGGYGDESPYVPEYHTGRRFSHQEPRRSSPRGHSHSSIDDSARRMSIHDSQQEAAENSRSYIGARASAVHEVNSGYGYQSGHYEYTRQQEPPQHHRSVQRTGSARTFPDMDTLFENGAAVGGSRHSSSPSQSPSPAHSMSQLSTAAAINGGGGGGAADDGQKHPLAPPSRLTHSASVASGVGGGGLHAVVNSVGSAMKRAASVNNCEAGTNGKNGNDTHLATQSSDIVAAHYEQTYDSVNAQVESARDILAASRSKSSGSLIHQLPKTPKNRNSNILSAVLCLIKELDGPSLEVAEMAIRCRMEELED